MYLLNFGWRDEFDLRKKNIANDVNMRSEGINFELSDLDNRLDIVGY